MIKNNRTDTDRAAELRIAYEIVRESDAEAERAARPRQTRSVTLEDGRVLDVPVLD